MVDVDAAAAAAAWCAAEARAAAGLIGFESALRDSIVLERALVGGTWGWWPSAPKGFEFDRGRMAWPPGVLLGLPLATSSPPPAWEAIFGVPLSLRPDLCDLMDDGVCGLAAEAFWEDLGPIRLWYM